MDRLYAAAFEYNRLVPETTSATPVFEPRALLGTVLDGRYRLTGHLATGGMGAVFRAQHIQLGKEVALKVMRPDLASTPELVARFRREAQIASLLAHPNIVTVSDFGKSREGYLFFAMELLEGETLFERLSRDGTLPIDEALEILIQVCLGLEAAHRLNVIHRDLKPENVFLERKGGRTAARVLDFGIAKLTGPANVSDTHSGIVVGTPEYLSPEQALGTDVDTRADIYSVGLIAWRMLGGRHPYQSDDAHALLMMQATQPVPAITEARPDLSAYPALVKVIARACAKSAADRPSSAAHLRAELERCAETPWGTLEPAPARPEMTLSAPASEPIPVMEAVTARIQPNLRLAWSLRLARIRAVLRRLWRRLRLKSG